MLIYISVIKQHQVILVLCFGCVSRQEVSECTQCVYGLVRSRCHPSDCYVLSFIPSASICPSVLLQGAICSDFLHYNNMEY